MPCDWPCTPSHHPGGHAAQLSSREPNHPSVMTSSEQRTTHNTAVWQHRSTQHATLAAFQRAAPSTAVDTIRACCRCRVLGLIPSRTPYPTRTPHMDDDDPPEADAISQPCGMHPWAVIIDDRVDVWNPASRRCVHKVGAQRCCTHVCTVQCGGGYCAGRTSCAAWGLASIVPALLWRDASTESIRATPGDAARKPISLSPTPKVFAVLPIACQSSRLCCGGVHAVSQASGREHSGHENPRHVTLVRCRDLSLHRSSCSGMT